MGDEDPALEGRPGSEGAAVAQNGARPENVDDGKAVVGDGPLGRQGRADDVDVRGHLEAAPGLGLAGQARLRRLRGDDQPTCRLGRAGATDTLLLAGAEASLATADRLSVAESNHGP